MLQRIKCHVPQLGRLYGNRCRFPSFIRGSFVLSQRSCEGDVPGRFQQLILTHSIFSSAEESSRKQASQCDREQKSGRKGERSRRILSDLLVTGAACVLAYTMVKTAIKKTRGDQAERWFTSVAANSPPSSDDVSDSKRRSKTYNFIADAVEIAAPAVVYIEVTSGKVHNHFFRLPGPTSSGSGFIANEKGMVITNAHVVTDAHKVRVKLRNGKEYDGIVVETDQVTDLAAVQILSSGEEKYPHLRLGESSKVRAGEWVAALGSPLQLTNTITAGIVSTLHRAGEELGLPNRDMTYIQTDAAINVGNSGGPLVNLDGEVIGINCITVQAASGISFAIPSDNVRNFLEEAEAKVEKVGPEKLAGSRKRYDRFYIGITMLTLTPAIVEELKQRSSRYADVQGGVFVPQVSFRSPAERAGMMSGDVIVSINGQPVMNAKQVYGEVRKGEQMTVEVLRGSKTVILTIQPSPVGKL